MKKGIIILVLLIIILVSAISESANYYVRPSGSSYGSGNGTTYADAWAGFAAVDWAGSFSGTANTLFVAGEHTTGMTPTVSGQNASNRIKIYSCTIDLGCSTTDPGIIKERTSGDGIYIHAVDYFEIKGLEIKNGPANTSGIKIHDSSDYITIDSCIVHHSGDTGIQVGEYTADPKPTYITISNNTVYRNASEGIYVTKTDNATVSGNTVYENGTGVNYLGSASGNGTGDGIEIKGNADSATVINNTIYDWSIGNAATVIGINLRGNAFIAYGNYVYLTSSFTNTNYKGIDIGPDSNESNTESLDSGLFYNNIVVMQGQTAVTMSIHATSTCSGIVIYNNTITGFGSGIYWANVNGYNRCSTTLKNNLFYGANSSSVQFYTMDTNSTGCIADSDYNWFYNPYGAGRSTFKAGSTYTYSNFKGLLSTDSHSSANDSTDPQIVSYKQSYGSGLINSGVDLSASFSIDILENRRPYGSAWDIGAYELTGYIPSLSGATLVGGRVVGE